jgi:hypothetical protein
MLCAESLGKQSVSCGAEVRERQEPGTGAKIEMVLGTQVN